MAQKINELKNKQFIIAHSAYTAATGQFQSAAKMHF